MLLFEFYLVNYVIICVNFFYALVVSGLLMLKAIVMLMLDPVLKLQSWFSELCFMSFVLCISISLYGGYKIICNLHHQKQPIIVYFWFFNIFLQSYDDQTSVMHMS